MSYIWPSPCQIYFPIYVITTANIANSLDRTGCNDNRSNISRRICVWRRRRSEDRREEKYPERREEKRDLWRRDIRVEKRVSIGACFAAVYFFGSRSLLSLSPPASLGKDLRERTRDAKYPFSSRYTFAPSGQYPRAGNPRLLRFN